MANAASLNPTKHVPIGDCQDQMHFVLKMACTCRLCFISCFLHAMQNTKSTAAPNNAAYTHTTPIITHTHDKVPIRLTSFLGIGVPLTGALHMLQEQSDDQDGSAQPDTAAWQGLKGVKIHLLTGDLNKTLISRTKYSNLFCAVLIGHRHAHLVDREHQLTKVAFPGALLAVETVRYMLQLNNKQVSHAQKPCESIAGAYRGNCSVQLFVSDAHQMLVAHVQRFESHNLHFIA